MYLDRSVLRYGVAMFELGGLATVFAESFVHISSHSGEEKMGGSKMELSFLVSAAPAEVGARLNGFWDGVGG